jgi:hypothetical protein
LAAAILFTVASSRTCRYALAVHPKRRPVGLRQR